MKDKAKVKFWLNGQVLFIQAEESGEVRTIKDEKKIAWFLNAHHLTVHEVKGVMVGYDVYHLFGKSKLFRLPTIRR